MANTTGYMGFKHIGFLPGFAPDYQLRSAVIGAANATGIYHGDPVIYSSGLIVRAEAAGTATIDGIFDGCTYVDSSGKTNFSPYCPASQTATAYILSAPGSLFAAQTNGTAITTANINKNIGFTVGTGQTTGGGFSLYTLDSTTVALNAAFPFRIVSLWSNLQPGAPNGADNTSSYNWLVVTINSSDFKLGVAGV